MATECDALRVVLLGKTGVGKSSTGNTLLGRDAFRVARGLRSGTEKCQWADAEVDDILLQVTDTPGLSDTHRPEEEVLKEVGKSIAVASPGPHVILMVIRCDACFTEEEFQAYTTLREMFGPDIKKYMILVFVGMDSYGDSLAEQNKGLQDTMKTVSGQLKEVLGDADWRYCGMNNKAKPPEKEKQAAELITMMKVLKRSRGGEYFKNSVSDHVNELVSPMVKARAAKGGVSEAEAVRETNMAIVEEKVPKDFFHNLMDFMLHKVVPLVKKGIAVVKTGYEVYKESKNCSVM